MKILEITQHSPEELFENLREVGMLTNPEVKPYANADMQLFGTNYIPNDIDPAQRYVLNSELIKVRNLRWALAEHSVDLFQLNGYVTIVTDESDEPIDVLPPIVEFSLEAAGKEYHILNDGMHRTYLALMEHAILQYVHVTGRRDMPPYYAFPLVDGWEDVELRDDIPDGYIKKWHRIQDYKSLYRDFNVAFTNVGGPRGHFALAK